MITISKKIRIEYFCVTKISTTVFIIIVDKIIKIKKIDLGFTRNIVCS